MYPINGPTPWSNHSTNDFPAERSFPHPGKNIYASPESKEASESSSVWRGFTSKTGHSIPLLDRFKSYSKRLLFALVGKTPPENKTSLSAKITGDGEGYKEPYPVDPTLASWQKSALPSSTIPQASNIYSQDSIAKSPNKTQETLNSRLSNLKLTPQDLQQPQFQDILESYQASDEAANLLLGITESGKLNQALPNPKSDESLEA